MNLGYIIKLWFSVVLVTPTLMILPNEFNLGIWFFAVIFGLALSFPSFLVIMLLALFLDNYIKDSVTMKICYIAGTLICMYITLSLFFTGKISAIEGPFGEFMLWYAIIILLFGMIYKVKTISDAPKEEDVA